MKTTVGAITIGQAPRVDLVPEIVEMTGGNISFVEKGALDDLTPEEIEELSPKRDEPTLVTRLKDGTQVIVGKKRIEEKVQEKIDLLETEEVDFVVLLCSGSFKNIKSNVPLLFPNGLLLGTLSSLTLPNYLGFLVPSKTQVPSATKEFESVGFSPVGLGASPYSNSEEVWKAAERLRDKNVDLIVLHCFGYTGQMKREVSEIAEKPVVLVRSVLARFLSEITG